MPGRLGEGLSSGTMPSAAHATHYRAEGKQASPMPKVSRLFLHRKEDIA
jgi:hypothetical protein